MNPELVRILRFLIAGAVNTAFGYAVYALLVLAHLPEQAALLLSFVIGVSFNYLTTARFVFAERGFGRVWPYVAVYACIYVANAVALHFATSAGIPSLTAQAVIVPVAAVITYLSMRRVFAPSKAAATPKA